MFNGHWRDWRKVSFKGRCPFKRGVFYASNANLGLGKVSFIYRLSVKTGFTVLYNVYIFCSLIHVNHTRYSWQQPLHSTRQIYAYIWEWQLELHVPSWDTQTIIEQYNFNIGLPYFMARIIIMCTCDRIPVISQKRILNCIRPDKKMFPTSPFQAPRPWLVWYWGSECECF